MDYAFERDWQTLVKRMMDRFGEEPDVTSMVFAVGLQEAGQGAKRFKKDEKMDLMHVGVCTLLEPLGYYCLLYTSPSPRDISGSRMPSSA